MLKRSKKKAFLKLAFDEDKENLNAYYVQKIFCLSIKENKLKYHFGTNNKNSENELILFFQCRLKSMH